MEYVFENVWEPGMYPWGVAKDRTIEEKGLSQC